MDRLHFHFDDDAVGTLIEGPTFWEAWLRRPSAPLLFSIRVRANPWTLDKAADLARAALEATQNVLSGKDPIVPPGVPLLIETLDGAEPRYVVLEP